MFVSYSFFLLQQRDVSEEILTTGEEDADQEAPPQTSGTGSGRCHTLIVVVTLISKKMNKIIDYMYVAVSQEMQICCSSGKGRSRCFHCGSRLRSTG